MSIAPSCSCKPLQGSKIRELYCNRDFVGRQVFVSITSAFSSSRRKFFLRRFQRLPLATRLLFLSFSDFLGLVLPKFTADSARQGFSLFHNNPKAIVFHVCLLDPGSLKNLCIELFDANLESLLLALILLDLVFLLLGNLQQRPKLVDRQG